MLSQSWWDGEDFIAEARSDASMLVTLAGSLGVGDAAPLITGFIAGAGAGTAGVNKTIQNAESIRNQREAQQDAGEDAEGMDEPAPDEEPDPARPTPF